MAIFILVLLFACFLCQVLAGMSRTTTSDMIPKKSVRTSTDSFSACAKLDIDRNINRGFLQRLHLAYKFSFFLFVFLLTIEDFILSRILQCTAEVK